jgi:predicted nucleotidyltransferase
MLIKNELDILSSFFPTLEEKTSKSIEESVKLSHEPVFRTLKSLVKNGYLKVRKVGKTNVYKFVFNEDSYLVYTYYMTKKLKSFKSSHSLLFKRIKEFAELTECESIILFGSYAKGEETKRSDIDVLCVGCSKDVEKIALSFKTKYNINISPVAVRKNSFKKIKTDNPAFYKDLIRFGIVFKGLEFFFREVYESS